MKKRFLILLLFALFVFEYQFIITPLLKKIKSTEDLINKKKNDYQKLKELLQEYKKRTANRTLKEEKKADKEFSLFSFISRKIEENGIISNISSIKPLPAEKKEKYELEKIEISIEEIPLNKLIEFLKTIENSNFPVYISEFTMARIKSKPSFLKVRIKLIAIKNG